MTKEGRPMIHYTPEELGFIDRYTAQGADFYKHGGNKYKKEEGYVYDPNYDYGGIGQGYDDEEKSLYASVAKKIIEYEYNRAKRLNPNNPLDTFIHNWRYGGDASKGYKDDADYYDTVRRKMK